MLKEKLGIDVKDITSVSAESMEAIRKAWEDTKSENPMNKKAFDFSYEFSEITSMLTWLEEINAEITSTNAELDDIRTKAENQMREAASVIITDVLNPVKFPKLSIKDLFNLEEIFNGVSWSDYSYEDIRLTVENAANELANDTTGTLADALKSANEHMDLAKKVGMSEEIRKALHDDLAQLNGTVFMDLLGEPMSQLLIQWNKEKQKVAEEMGDNGQAVLDRLSENGVLTQPVLDAVTQGIEALEEKGEDVDKATNELLTIDLGTTEAEAIANIKEYFKNVGAETDKDLQALNKLLTSANEAIVESAQDIGTNKLKRTNYKDIFDMLIGTEGMTLQQAALNTARGLLAGITDNEETIQKYAETILKNFLGENDWIVDYIDQESGTLSADAWEAGKETGEETSRALSQGFLDGMASSAASLLRPSQLRDIMSGLFASAGEVMRSSAKEEMRGFDVGNAELFDRPVIDASKLANANWEDAGEGIATIFSSSYSAGMGEDYDFVYDKNVIIDVTPIMSTGVVLTPDNLANYLRDIVGKATKEGTSILEADKPENGGLGLIIDVSNVEGDLNQAFDEAGERMERLHELQAI